MIFLILVKGTALFTQTTCSLPIGQKYISTNFNQFGDCENYTLPIITNIFCSLDTNDTTVTLTPPTYWPSTTTTNGNETIESNVSLFIE